MKRIAQVDPDTTNIPAVDFRELISLCEFLTTMIGLSQIRWMKTSTVPLTYNYRLMYSDGRVWQQNVVFSTPVDADPGMQFNMGTDLWKESEFSLQRPLRDLLVKITKNGSGVEMFKYTGAP